jgi:hypothetical protein
VCASPSQAAGHYQSWTVTRNTIHPLIDVLNAVGFGMKQNHDGQNLVEVVSITIGMRSNISSAAT